MARYAIIRATLVENVTDWDGDTSGWQPPSGTSAVLCPSNVGPGYTYNGSAWTAPAVRAPADPDDWPFTPRDFMIALGDAFVKNGMFTRAKVDAWLLDVRAALKR